MAWLNAFKQPSTAPENRSKVPYLFRRKKWFSWLFILGTTQGTSQALTAAPGWSAEQIVIHYGSFQGTIPLDELETSLKSGQQTPPDTRSPADAALAVPTGLKKLLTQPLPFLSPEQTNNLFHSPAGNTLLEAAAGVFLVGDSPQQGAENLRRALVDAAAATQPFTGLNVLRHFPGDIHWNARKTMALLQQHQASQGDTENFLLLLDESLEQSSNQPAMSEQLVALADERASISPWEQEDLRLPGDWTYDQRELQLWDRYRDRHFMAQLYLPKIKAAAYSGLAASPDAQQLESNAIPLLVMSHGLAANRHSRSFLAAHLASHGIAVAMMQHPGSDSEQFHNLLQGKTNQIATAESFIDRPQDVSFLLDELHYRIQPNAGSDQNISTRRDRPTLAGYPLNLDQVALFGHSFGAYTALALAGANINFAQLHQDCQPEAMLLDFSLVLQCQALGLEATQPLPQLKDDRVTALMLADPVSRSIFGPQELAKVKLPVVWNGGDRDPFTPFMTSQLPSFQWLGSRDKHLAIAEATSHVYLKPRGQQLDVQSGSSNLTERVIAQPQVVQDYTNALGLAFARTYLQKELRYRNYLTASYGQQLSQAPYHLRLWSSPSALPVQLLSEQQRSGL